MCYNELTNLRNFVKSVQNGEKICLRRKIMKKRILSILLAVMMVVPMLTMAIPVSAAGVSNNYSYKFEAEDARNFVEGQVLDLGNAGEAETAPAMNGELSAYQGSKTLTSSGKNTYQSYYAVKDGYFYVAVETDDDQRLGAQFAIGVSQYASSDGALSRLSFNWNQNGNFALSRYLKFPQPSKEGSKYVNRGTEWVYNSTETVIAQPATGAADFEPEYTFNKGVYEFKINILALYRYFDASVRRDGIYETPCLTFFFVHNLNNTEGTNANTQKAYEGQTFYYSAVGVKCSIDYEGENVGSLPATIIIPKESLAEVQRKSKDSSIIGAVGASGTDHRNWAVNQYNALGVYDNTAPKLDGVIDPGEYTKTNDSLYLAGNTANANGSISFSLTEDGYMYIAGRVPGANQDTKLQIGVGLVNNSGGLMTSRLQFGIDKDCNLSNANFLIRSPYDHNNWTYKNEDADNIKPFGLTQSDFEGTSKNYCYGNNLPAEKAARSYEKVGETDYAIFEMKVALAPMLAIYEAYGWNISTMNCVSVAAYNSSKWLTAVAGDGSQLSTYSFTNCNDKYSYPTFGLPTGATEKFYIDDVDDLEPYGQHHLDVVKTDTVVLDGVISEREYGASYNYTTDALSAKGISGVNYFSANEDYIYIGATVKDPTFVPGKSNYQYDITLLPKDDKVDLGDTITRVNGRIYYMNDGSTVLGNPGIIYRSQTHIAADNPVEEDLEAVITSLGKANIVQGKAGYDQETQTVTYEVAFKKDSLRQIFGYDNDYDFDSFTYFNYVDTDYGDTTDKEGNPIKANRTQVFTNLADYGRAFVTIKWLTLRDHNGTLAYDNTPMPGAAVLNFAEGMVTKNSASVRISTVNAGLRFKTTFSNGYLAKMAAYAESKGETMEVGTLIAPDNYIVDKNFTHAALGNGNYVEVMADVNNAYENKYGVTTIAGSLVNIKPSNLDRDFAGRGFIRIGDEYFYAEDYTVRNIKDVATAALADPSANYTDGQREILGKLNGTVQ